MKYKNVVCPHCKGKLKIEAGEDLFICPFCESTLELDEITNKVTVTESADEVTDSVPKKKKRKKKNSMIALGVTLGVFLLIIATAYIFRHQIINFFTEPEKDSRADPAPYGPAETLENDPSPNQPDDHDKIYNFLICGHDRVADNTDVNLLVSFNVSKLTCAIMQIPRDIYVSHDYNGAHKCNTVFQYFKHGGNSTNEYIQSAIDQYDVNTESDLRGIAGFAAFLEQNLCVKIHYYAVMDLTQFSNIVDALGGVEMNVPFRLYYVDPNQDLYIDIYPGWQTLDGHAAEGVVRYREGYANADIGRGNVQKLFMTALFRTIQDKANIFNIGKITDVCGIISENLHTNMTTKDMIYFANNAMTLDLQYVTFMTMPGAGFWGDDGLAYYTLNKALTKDYINGYFNIYDEEVTDEQFDSNGVFYTTSYYYSCPASEMPQYIYSASDMESEDFVPVVGYN